MSDMNEPSDQQILNLINSFKKKQIREKINYDKRKDDEDFKILNRQRASEYHSKNKDKKRAAYMKNKQRVNYRNLYNYYKRENRLEDFETKHPEKLEYLINHGLVASSSA